MTDPIEKKIREQELKPARPSLWSRIAKLFKPPRIRPARKRGKR